MKRSIDRFFTGILLAALLYGLADAVFFPEEINEYENRYMEQFEPLTLASYLDGTFQDQAEKALADQLPFAIDAKESYNSNVSALTDKILDRLLAGYRAQLEEEEKAREAERLAEEEEARRKEEEIKALKERAKEAELSEAEKKALEEAKEAERLAKEEAEKAAILQEELQRGIYRGTRNPVETDPAEIYFTLPSGRLVYKNHLMFAGRFLPGEQQKLDKYIEGINSLIARHPEITFYTYYIEKETDVNFLTGERSGIFEYLHDNIQLPEESKRGFMIDRFRDFDAWFFKTDHHWAAAGSYRGYTQVLDMLLPGEEPLAPTGFTELGKISGSKATGTDTESYTETAGVLTFDFSDVNITLNKESSPEYGRQLAYIDHVKETGQLYGKLTYGAIYGPDSGEAMFENPASDNGSLLILGESYDNAINLLLSNHFSTIYNVDLRNYKAQMGSAFDFDRYVLDHNITRVLLIGNLDYYVLEAFRLK